MSWLDDRRSPRYPVPTAAEWRDADRCNTCAHEWHGLRCERRIQAVDDPKLVFRPCPCRGPFAGEASCPTTPPA